MPQPTCCVHSVQGTGLPLQSTCVHTCGCTGQPRIKAAWGRGNTFFSLMACEPLTRCPMHLWPIQNDKVQHTASGMEKSLTGSQPCMPAWSNEPLPTQPISRGCAFQPRKRPGHPAQHRPSNHPAAHTSAPATVLNTAAPPSLWASGLRQAGRWAHKPAQEAHGGLESRLAALAPPGCPLPALDPFPGKKRDLNVGLVLYNTQVSSKDIIHTWK